MAQAPEAAGPTVPPMFMSASRFGQTDQPPAAEADAVSSAVWKLLVLRAPPALVRIIGTQVSTQPLPPSSAPMGTSLHMCHWICLPLCSPGSLMSRPFMMLPSTERFPSHTTTTYCFCLTGRPGMRSRYCTWVLCQHPSSWQMSGVAQTWVWHLFRPNTTPPRPGAGGVCLWGFWAVDRPAA